MAIIDDLIQIYASKPSDEVGADPSFGRLCEENDKDNVFHATRNRVEGIKRELEDRTGIQRSYQKQARYALEFYSQLSGSEDEEDEICLRIVRLAYFPKWTDKQKKYFDEVCTTIQQKSDYFLSFTQRNPINAGNPINSYHRHLIMNFGFDDPQSNPANEFARMLDGLLKDPKFGLRGFFYPEHEDNSAEVIKKLSDNIDQCLVFIQVVQNEMFSKKYDRKKNYCFMEYTWAANKKKKMILVFADGKYPTDLIVQGAVDYAFNGWYKFVADLDPVMSHQCVSSKRRLTSLGIGQN